MQGRLDLAPIGRAVAATGLGIVGAAQFDHGATLVPDSLAAGDEISETQAHLAAGTEPIEFLRRFLHEIVGFDIKLAAERHLAHPSRWIGGMVRRLEGLGLTFRIILDHQLDRVEHRHAARGFPVEPLADAMFEQRQFNQIIGLGDTDAGDEIA